VSTEQLRPSGSSTRPCARSLMRAAPGSARYLSLIGPWMSRSVVASIDAPSSVFAVWIWLAVFTLWTEFTLTERCGLCAIVTLWGGGEERLGGPRRKAATHEDDLGGDLHVRMPAMHRLRRATYGRGRHRRRAH